MAVGATVYTVHQNAQLLQGVGWMDGWMDGWILHAVVPTASL